MANLVEIYKNIINETVDPDQYVSTIDDYGVIYGKPVNPLSIRLSKLKSHNTLMSKLLSKCVDNNLDIYISGSLSIWSILESTNYYPNDIDIYIKEISHDKIILLESIIKSLTNNDVMIMYRPLYINFVIINTIDITNTDIDSYKHTKCCHSNLKTETIVFQLSTIYFRHIVEIFASYHSGIVCTAYSLNLNNFIYMREKFGSTTMSNLTGLGVSSEHFKNLVKKYRDRGFACTSEFDNNLPKFKDIFIISPDEHSFVSGGSMYRVVQSQIRSGINYCGNTKEYTNGKQGRSSLFQHFMCDLSKPRSIINDIIENNKCIYPSVSIFISDIEFLDSKFLFTNIVDAGQSDYYINYYKNLNNTSRCNNQLYCYICKQFVCDVTMFLPYLEKTKSNNNTFDVVILDDNHTLRKYCASYYIKCAHNECKIACVYDKIYGIVPKKIMYGGKR
jgi:hypothetical protein